MSRRTAALIVVTALVSVLGLLTAPPARACACGGFVAADGEQVAASAEYAVLAFDGSNERMLLSMSTLTETADAALLLPTPTPARAALAEPEVFAELEELTAPELVIRWRWWPELSLGEGANSAPGAAGGAPVTVLDTRQLGDLEVTVLAASDATALTEWLHGHGYVLPDGLADALAPYVTEGWYYTAIRLTTDAEDLSGTLQPLDLTFASDELVYPMRLSAAATSSQFVRTYVFADHRMKRTDPTADHGQSDLRFAGRIDPSAVSAASLTSVVADQPYLTVLDQYFADPASQIDSDFTFGQAASDTPYRRTSYEVRTRTILGVPAGPMVTFGGVLLLNLAIAGGLLWRRHRNPRA